MYVSRISADISCLCHVSSESSAEEAQHAKFQALVRVAQGVYVGHANDGGLTNQLAINMTRFGTLLTVQQFVNSNLKLEVSVLEPIDGPKPSQRQAYHSLHGFDMNA